MEKKDYQAKQLNIEYFLIGSIGKYNSYTSLWWTKRKDTIQQYEVWIRKFKMVLISETNWKFALTI